VSIELIGLALLMGAVTYPSRALPLLVPRFERLPAFAALAAAGVLFVADEPGIRIGVELVAVLACVAIVAWRKSLLIGIAVAVGLVAVARALGYA
jgi:branched-subunit amino acid transport protein